MARRTQIQFSRNTVSPVDWGNSLRNWWRSYDYNPTTGLWEASHGAGLHNLTQSTATRRPSRTLENAAFGGFSTVDSDGVDDALSCANAFALAAQPNTFGVLMQVLGPGSASYIGGQYAQSSYQFYRADFETDVLSTDPSGQQYHAACVNNVHLWLFSKDGTQLIPYKDGVALGARTMASSSGSPGSFWLFSAGSGSLRASIAEVFALDAPVSADQARMLTAYFQRIGYPIARWLPSVEVWILLGDSEASGRGNPADLITVYPGYPPANLYMLRSNETWRNLVEPCADGNYPPVGVGPGGMFGAMRAQQIGRDVAIINCGIGSLKSSDWLPGTAAYNAAIQRGLAALTRDGSYLGGYLLYDGANDATNAVSTWRDNWEITFAAIQSELGSGPLIYTVLPFTVPTYQGPYPTWNTTREQQISWASTFRVPAQAPEGPWQDGLHLSTEGNFIHAQRMFACTSHFAFPQSNLLQI